MSRPATQWFYTYQDIADLIGVDPESVRKTASRGGFDPQNLQSILLYAAANATDQFRVDLICAAMRTGSFSVPKPPAAIKKKKDAAKRKRAGE